jgi:hypothetical protein
MSEVTVALGGNLPTGDANGLIDMGSEFVKDEASKKKIRAAIVLFDIQKEVRKTDDGSRTAVARIRRIEVVRDSDDFTIMQRLLMREFERRTGQATLPFELEQDIESLLSEVDLETDEKPDAETDTSSDSSTLDGVGVVDTDTTTADDEPSGEETNDGEGQRDPWDAAWNGDDGRDGGDPTDRS